MAHEHHLRSIAKAVSWRLCGSLATAGIVYLYTGRLALSVQIGSFELVAKIAIFYFHERLWARLPWGSKGG